MLPLDASIQSQDRRTLRKFSCSLEVSCFLRLVSSTKCKYLTFIKVQKCFPSGGIVFASIDQVPHDLIDNAIVFGCLSFFVAFVFLIDMSEKMGKRRSNATQTDTSSIDRHHTKSLSSTTINSQANLIDSDESNRRNRDSMRQSNGQRNGSSQQTGAQVQQSMNPFVNPPIANDQRQQSSQEQSFTDYHHDSQPPSMHQTQQYPSSSYSEDVIETQTFPTAQQPVFSKVKQNPTPISHLETEPYRKILSRTNQPVSYTRYHDQAKHHNDPSFYDDFNSFRKQTYYQGPRVDQGKLMVIRDYSQQAPAQELQKHACNCQSHHCEENDDQERENVTIKSGYVSQVAKLWDSRMKSNEGSVRSHQKDIIGFNTVV